MIMISSIFLTYKIISFFQSLTIKMLLFPLLIFSRMTKTIFKTKFDIYEYFWSNVNIVKEYIFDFFSIKKMIIRMNNLCM